MKKELIVRCLVGVPGSGKTTYTKKFLSNPNNSNWVSVNRDAFRYMFRDSGWTEEKIESMITELVEISIVKSLNRKLNVIIDATNLKRSYIEKFVDLVKYKAIVEFLPFNVPLETCLERDKNREQSVGEKVIRNMYKDWLNLIDSDVFTTRPIQPSHLNKFIPLKQDITLPQAVIYDIDGNIAQMGKRGPFDWHKVHIDDPIEVVIDSIRLNKSVGRTILLVTGRDAVCKEETKLWLEYHNVPYDMLFMRPENNFEKDYKVKTDIFNEYIKDKYNVLAVYDDRLQVIQKAWFKLGIFCFTTNQGIVEF